MDSHGKQAQLEVIVFCLSRARLWNRNLLRKKCSSLLPHKQKKKKPLGRGVTRVKVLLGEGLCVHWHTLVLGSALVLHLDPQGAPWVAGSMISGLLRRTRPIMSRQEAWAFILL